MQYVPSFTLQSGQRGLHAKCPVIHTSVRTEGSSCKMSCHPCFSQGRGVFMQNVLSSTLQSGQRGLQTKCPIIHTSVRAEGSSCKMSCHPRFCQDREVFMQCPLSSHYCTAIQGTCSQLSGFHPRSCQWLFSFGAVTQG